MTHTGEEKRPTFTPNMVEIAEISLEQVVAIGYADHHESMYKFSKFLPTSSDQALQSHANQVSKLWHERFGHMNYRYLQTFHNEGMVEGLPQIHPSTGACIGCVIGEHPKQSYEKGKEMRETQPLGCCILILFFHYPLPYMVDLGMCLHSLMTTLDFAGCIF